jgi:hypothetical protein
MLNDSIRTLRTLNIKILDEVEVSIYADVSLYIHVHKDGYSRSAIFTTLFPFKCLYLFILCTDSHKHRYKR